ncbi:FAS1-like dehydratase domain-containing protein [Roseibium aggregatum]|uniref:MaoC family dehydratase N-terminal domain-containing protein n=1 Tax=Roseibium aggregatum TaxID=187304 RepID=A0A939EIZ2_9HYPH|nr:MaoC family dehydratase N-terminal domain-containing protein [Roseibium aggregatum]MBN9673879.1 MaoC family dehydratase N-terminal domain-containing protein [Roseibium aggregatum]
MTSAASEWIGRKREASETITDRQIHEFRVTLDGFLGEGEDLPGFHWCLVPEIYPPEDLGRDGHPKLGLFLPDLGLPRRMWAGGRVCYHGGIRAGETVTRQTTVKDIQFKEGRSGTLGFVTLDHDYLFDRELRISEQHNIVYREDPAPGAPALTPPKAEAWTVLKSIEVLPTPTLLFRYSAMTFNGHRIHYDKAYATGVEGYDGLVVHGPLQSTWMQILATRILQRLPKEFSYRGVSPLICGRPAVVEAMESEPGTLALRVRDKDNDVVTMEARAA